MSKEGTDAAEAFESVAGKSFQEFINEGGNVQEAMAMMQEAAEKNGVSVKDLFGNIRAGQAAMQLTGKAAGKFEENLKGMNDSAGATSDAYSEMDKTLARSWEKLTVLFDDLWKSIGERVAPVVADFVDYMIENMPQIQATVERVFDGVIKAINWAIDAYKNIKEFIQGFANTNSSYLNDVLTDYQDIFASVREIITIFVDWATAFWEKYGEDITKVVKVMFTNLKRVFDLQLDNIKKLLSGVIKLMKGDFKGFGEDIGAIISQTWEAAAKIINSSWSKVIKPALTSLIDNIVEHIGKVPNKMLEIGGEIVGGLQDGITGKAKEAIGTIKDFGENLLGGVKDVLGIKSPSKEFATVGKNIMQGLAQGIGDHQKLAVERLNNALTEIEEQEKYQSNVRKNIREEMEKGRIAAAQAAVEAEKQREAKITEMYLAHQEARKESYLKRIEKEKEMEQTRAEYQQNVQDRMMEEYRKGQILAAKLAQDSAWQSQTAWQKAGEFIGTAIKNASGAIKSSMSNAFYSIMKGTKSVTQAFGDLWQGVIDAVIQQLAQMAASKVFNFIISGGMGGGGIFGAIGSFLGFQTGGVVPGPVGAPQPAIVHGGEEVLTPSQRKRGGMNGTANITVELDGEVLARAVEEPLTDNIRVKGGVRF